MRSMLYVELQTITTEYAYCDFKLKKNQQLTSIGNIQARTLNTPGSLKTKKSVFGICTAKTL